MSDTPTLVAAAAAVLAPAYPELTAGELARRLDADAPAGQRFLTVRQAANSLQVCPRTVRNWIKSGRLQAVRVNATTLRIPIAALEAL